MTVYLLSGESRDHRGCEGAVHEGVLRVYRARPMGFGSGDLVAAYPLTSIERWEP